MLAICMNYLLVFLVSYVQTIIVSKALKVAAIERAFISVMQRINQPWLETHTASIQILARH